MNYFASLLRSSVAILVHAFESSSQRAATYPTSNGFIGMMASVSPAASSSRLEVLPKKRKVCDKDREDFLSERCDNDTDSIAMPGKDDVFDLCKLCAASQLPNALPAATSTMQAVPWLAPAHRPITLCKNK